VNAHLGALAGDGHQAVFDGERADPRQHVAAVLRTIHARLVHHDLQEEIIDVRVRTAGAADDCYLAGETVGTAEPIDLAYVRRTHDCQQYAVAHCGIRGEAVGEKERALGGSTPHQRAGNGGLQRFWHGPATCTRAQARPASRASCTDPAPARLRRAACASPLRWRCAAWPLPRP